MLENIEIKSIIKGTISNPRNNSKYIKGYIRPVEIKENSMMQIELFTKTQSFAHNYNYDEFSEIINTIMLDSFFQLNIITNEYNYSFKYTKKNHLLSNKIKNKEIKTLLNVSHNKQKKYILNDGNIIPPLVDLGVMTQDGKIVPSYYDKYRQINRFLEIIDDTIKDFKEQELNIIDFGCGKSYLTFIVYYYLVNIKKIKTNIIGLDLKADVIKKCNEIAKNYGYNSLNFEIGDISLYKPHFRVDLIITLHACDVATDYAMYHAIKLHSKYLLSVPCCQHEINNQIKKSSSFLASYGIVKERMSALLTDTIRAKLLEYSGYNVDILEFVDFDASPKNLLVRAKYTGNSNAKALDEVNQILDEFKIVQTLYKLLFKSSNWRTFYFGVKLQYYLNSLVLLIFQTLNLQ